jgi:hypothetical protein
MACRALQSLSAVGNFKTRFAKGTNKNLQQFRVHCHSEEMVARGPELRNHAVGAACDRAYKHQVVLRTTLLLVFGFSRGAGLRMRDNFVGKM